MLRSFLSLLGVLLFCLVAAVYPSPSNYFQVIERLASVPHGWTQGGVPDKSTVIRFRLAVHQENEDIFHQKVLNISTPGHPLYGLHMKRDELKDFLRPRAEVSAQLMSWLTSGGLSSGNIEDGGAWITFHATVEQAERLLNTRFYNFIDEQTKYSRIRTLEYSIPASIAPNVHMIQPTTMFSRFQPADSTMLRTDPLPVKNSVANRPIGCDLQITPYCLRKLYNIPHCKGLQGIANKVGVSGYLEQYAQYKDLNSFLARFVPEAVGANFSVQSINGGLNTQDSLKNSLEANLDIQYVIGLHCTSNVTYYTTAGRGMLVPDLDQPDPNHHTNEPYLEQLHSLLALPDEDLPTVLSTSYGENEQSVPAQYAKSACNLFAQLGARGISVIFSSGDSGVGSACQSNDGKNRTVFNPIFPASCPFVTSVGATQGINPERAARFSSGGFSERFARPAYQEKAVGAYLEKLGKTWEGLYNPNGRAFPDIAAQGVRYAIFDKGRITYVSGTSASAPTIAAIISHLNAMRLSQKQPVLGFLNPWIYSSGFQGFRDITDGGSTGCIGKEVSPGVRTAFVPNASWNATQGWDPVTGFGTPNFSKLVELLPTGGADTCGKGGRNVNGM
ncbi:tripeptidyl-peptidase I [[Emmonsia] crescens]|uniref:tripeptidyl-peptidase II n=1 Tax=[Emmonsia] crescens TaxID=73230 RepID=A0A2B7ZP50_9EURO|nr:tripeptidyl-peptidase I [Emmonsia crescens]